MRKFLLGLVCCLFVVGVANMGHALKIPFLGGSSGGHGGQGGNGGPNQVAAAHYDFNFMRNLPEGPTKGGDGPVFGQFDTDSNRHGWNGGGGLNVGGGSVQTNPVPEPATMILFGVGLIGLAGFGRRKFNK